MRCPHLVLIPYLENKIKFVCFFNKRDEISPLIFEMNPPHT
jgi:hypothetical protein